MPNAQVKPLDTLVVSDYHSGMKNKQNPIAPKDERAVIKLNRSLYDEIKEVQAQIARNGWASAGVDRADPATVAAIIEQGVKLLGERIKTKRGER